MSRREELSSDVIKHECRPHISWILHVAHPHNYITCAARRSIPSQFTSKLFNAWKGVMWRLCEWILKTLIMPGTRSPALTSQQNSILIDLTAVRFMQCPSTSTVTSDVIGLTWWNVSSLFPAESVYGVPKHDMTRQDRSPSDQAR